MYEGFFWDPVYVGGIGGVLATRNATGAVAVKIIASTKIDSRGVPTRGDIS